MELKSPRCPGCDVEPALIVGIQGLCGNDDCQVLTWDMTDLPEQFKAKAVAVDLSDLPESKGKSE